VEGLPDIDVTRHARLTTRRVRIVALAATTAVLVTASLFGCKTRPARVPAPAPPPVQAPELRALNPLFEDIERRTFNYFWETAEPGTGLVPDRWPRAPFASVAATGFALNAYAIGVERGYITRAQGRARVLTTLKFLYELPQGPDPADVAGYQGFFYHFLNFGTGKRYGNCELSTVDTALMMAGVLFAAGYFTGDDPEEVQLRDYAEKLYRRVNWPWAVEYTPDIRMAWWPEQHFGQDDWRGYNEGMIVFVLALGSPSYPARDHAWHAWTSNYYRHWGTLEGQTHLTFGPLFGHQFSAVWIDYRGIKDEFMWPQGIDYFENSRRGVLSQRAYAIRNPLDWKGYGPNVWGLTASDGPGDFELDYRGQKRKFYSYAARGVGLPGVDGVLDDGTIAPTAAISSLPFAPEVVLPAAQTMHQRYGRHIYGRYGFVDAFNPSFEYDVKLTRGKRVRGVGWVDSDYISIDQGPIIAMIENYRSELIWKVMKRNPYIQRGLLRAGFEGGWINEIPPNPP
jgi:hypothetical protein